MTPEEKRISELEDRLIAMCEMWNSVCETNGWDANRMSQYTDALETLNIRSIEEEILYAIKYIKEHDSDE